MSSPPPARSDKERFAALLAEHKGILYRVANGYCRERDQRSDLIQDIVVQLWRAFPRFDGRCRFSTWMYRVAMNVAISAHRSERRRTRDTVPLDDLGLELAASDRVMDEASDDVRLLNRLIGALDDLNRALIILYIDGCSHDEIAEILGISATNASTRISRLKERLQRELEAERRDEPGEGAGT